MPRAESEAPNQTSRISVEIEIADSGLLLALTGPNGAHLKPLEKGLGVNFGLRGHTLRMIGPAKAVELAERAVAELLDVARRGGLLSEREIERSIATLKRHPEVRLTTMLDDEVTVGNGKKNVAPKGVAQQQYLRAMRDHDIVFGVGPAGTGKTYLAMAAAVSALVARKYKRIILTRPAVEAGERLGFLPGDLAEKVNPYLRPLYDALHDMMEMEKAQDLLTRGAIEVAPLAFMRGRTLNSSFVILDEAQNTTTDQMKMFLTRLGYDSKAVVTGDVTQVDLPTGSRSGLSDALSLLKDVEGISICRFTDVDIVRHPLVQRIVRAYDARDVQRNRLYDAQRPARWRRDREPEPEADGDDDLEQGE